MTFYTFLPRLLNMSFTASVVILFVIIVRMCIKKAPKVIAYGLWSIVLFRLLCPVSIESDLSLFGLLDTPVTKSGAMTSSIEYVPHNIVHTEYPAVVLPLPGISDMINDALPEGREQLSVDPLEAPVSMATYVWMLGVFGMVAYAGSSYVRLRRKLTIVSPLRDNIYLADDIASPFVMGIIRPKIYLPSAMEEREMPYIILHEQYHVRRLDHLTRVLAFVALCIHWFNPLVWLAFILSGKDMEMSCDEAVVKKMGDGVLADYTASLLSLATGKRVIAGMPLAFGEGDTKGRIRNLVNWKKPSFWIVLAAALACLVLAALLLTNPSETQFKDLKPLYTQNYEVAEVIYESPGFSFSMVPYQNTPSYFIGEGMTLASRGEHETGEKWVTLGNLSEVELNKENFDKLFFGNQREEKGWRTGESAKSIRKNTKKAWTLIYNQSTLYYVLQQKNGDIYLAYGYYDYSEKEDVYSDDTNIRWLFKLAVEDTGNLTYKESAMGEARWEHIPYSSSQSPVFQFQFDMDYEEISAVCERGNLVEFNYGDRKSGWEITVPSGYPLCWSPIADDILNQNTKISFTIHTKEDVFYNGVLYLECESDGENGRSVYTAALIGTGLHLSQNTEGEGGIISLVESEAEIGKSVNSEINWGITLTAKNITPTGLTLVITQSGGAPTGRLQYGSDYHLEGLEKGAWKDVPFIIDNAAWTQEAYMVAMDDSEELEISWKVFHGKLQPGTYRISKGFMDFRETGDYDTQRFYAEFVIE